MSISRQHADFKEFNAVMHINDASISAKDQDRKKIQDDIDRFLADGGKIQVLDMSENSKFSEDFMTKRDRMIRDRHNERRRKNRENGVSGDWS